MKSSRLEFSERDRYINSIFGIEDKMLELIRQRLRRDGKEGINVGPYEGRLLQFLVRLVKAQKVVEIGTLYGYSALWMARGLAEGGSLYCLEINENNLQTSRELLNQSEVADRIELIGGDATSSLKSLESKGPFDVVFIDANKAGYLQYLDWADKNVRTGGLIIGDNTFLFGKVLGNQAASSDDSNDEVTECMRRFNLRLADSRKYNSVLIPTCEGMTIAQKL